MIYHYFFYDLPPTIFLFPSQSKTMSNTATTPPTGVPIKAFGNMTTSFVNSKGQTVLIPVPLCETTEQQNMVVRGAMFALQMRLFAVKLQALVRGCAVRLRIMGWPDASVRDALKAKRMVFAEHLRLHGEKFDRAGYIQEYIDKLTTPVKSSASSDDDDDTVRRVHPRLGDKNDDEGLHHSLHRVRVAEEDRYQLGFDSDTESENLIARAANMNQSD